MTEKEAFADIHCHTLLKYFQKGNKNLWNSIGFPNPLYQYLNILRYSVSDLKRLSKGNVEVACIALTPPEQKTLFFKNNKWNWALNLFSSFLSRIPLRKIRFYQSEEYDHYTLLKEEYHFYLDGQSQERTIRFKGGDRKICSYKMIKNAAELDYILASNELAPERRMIALVLTVEAAHGLGCGHVEFDGKLNKHNVNEKTLLERVDAIKGIGSAKETAWEISPLWMTMAHAFNNDLCGHSQPLNRTLKKILYYAEPFDSNFMPSNYNGSINKGFTSTGRKVTERLLGIDELSKQRKSPGNRVLIDIKHMSTKTRQEFYQILDMHHLQNPHDNIPIVMSHGAVNGKKHLNDCNFCPKDQDEEWENSESFNPWSINLYDEEIVRIHKSKGLIGLTFFEPILAGKKRLKNKIFCPTKDWARIFSDQIEYILKTIYSSQEIENKYETWDRICIGSDFDGQLNPLDRFASSEKLPKFKKYLIDKLKEKRFEPYRENYTPDELAGKICYSNTISFLKENYNNYSESKTSSYSEDVAKISLN